jgi:hypothetical protein
MTLFAYIILLSSHLILMGIAAIGPLITVSWDIYHRNKKEDVHRDLVRKFANFSLLSLLLGILTGFAIFGLLMVMRSPEISQVQAKNTFLSNTITKNISEVISGGSSIRFWSELGFSAVCLTVAVVLLHYKSKRRILVRLLQFLSGTNLVYHFPILFVTITQISFASIGEELPYSRAVYSQKLHSSELWGAVIHNWGAMLIAATICLLMIGLRLNKVQAKQLNQLSEAKLSFSTPISVGAGMILIGIGWQTLSGIFALLQMNDLRQSHFLGDNLYCTGLLVAGVLNAFCSLPSLLELYMSAKEISLKNTQRKILLVHALLGCTWFFMTGAVILGRISH